jgi:hypothetical protein
VDSDSIKQLTKAIKRQNRLLSPDQVILRGCVLGVCYALGATVGFAIVIAILASITSIIGEIPILSDILESTGIATIIEYQLNEIEEQTGGDLNGDGNQQQSDEQVEEDADVGEDVEPAAPIVSPSPTPSVSE